MAPADSPAMKLIVTGSEFAPEMVVHWNGEPRETRFLDSSTLEAWISASDLAYPQLASVSVTAGPSGTKVAEDIAFPVFLALWNHDLIYDKLRRRLYVSVSSEDANGPSVAVVNPDPGIIESYVMLNEEDGEPGVLAISDDSRYLYVGMAGAVKRIDLATMTPDLDIPTGYYPTGSMTVLPGVNTSLVVTHTSGAAAVFDGARKRPNELGGGGHFAPGYLTGGPNSSTIYGSGGGGSGGGDFFELAIDEQGISVAEHIPSLLGNTGPPVYADGILYSQWGMFLDPARGSLIGRFPAAGLIRPLPELGRTVILGGDLAIGFSSPNAPLHLMVFENFTDRRLAAIRLPAVMSHSRARLEHWGADGLAFRETNPHDRSTERVFLFRIAALTE